MSFFYSVEFYVILAVIAAAIVAFAARPAAKGPAEEYLLAGRLEDGHADAQPEIELECLDNGAVLLRRRGVEGIADDGAVSLAIKKIGADVSIEERLTTGRGPLVPSIEATFALNFLPVGRYHIKYNSGKMGLFAAFPFHVTPGLRTIKPLNR